MPGHPKPQTMQTADWRLQAVTPFFRFYSYKVVRAQYVQMFAIYPQAAHAQHLNVHSIDKRV